MQSGATDFLVKQSLTAELLERSLRYAIRQKLDEDKLLRLAHFDPLTELANRSLFKGALEQIILHSSRMEEHFALITLDLDHFKLVNDTWGHDAGDALLCEVATRLKTLLVSPSALVTKTT